MFEKMKEATIVATPHGRIVIVRKALLPMNSLARSPALMKARKNWNARAPKLTGRVYTLELRRPRTTRAWSIDRQLDANGVSKLSKIAATVRQVVTKFTYDTA